MVVKLMPLYLYFCYYVEGYKEEHSADI